MNLLKKKWLKGLETAGRRLDTDLRFCVFQGCTHFRQYIFVYAFPFSLCTFSTNVSSCLLWPVGTSTQLCRGGRRNTSGSHRHQVSHRETGHAESLCSGSLPIPIRGSSHRLPRHHLETPAVSTPVCLVYIDEKKRSSTLCVCVLHAASPVSACQKSEVCVCLGTQ